MTLGLTNITELAMELLQEEFELKQFSVTCWPAKDKIPRNKNVFIELDRCINNWQRHSGNRCVLVHCRYVNVVFKKLCISCILEVIF